MPSVPPAPEPDLELREEPFSLHEHVVGGVPVLAISGEVDLAAAPAVRDALGALLAGGSPDAGPNGQVVVDLSGVRFIDSTGLSALVAAHTRSVENGGELRLAAVPPGVRQVLELTGLDGLFAIYEDVPSALDASSGPAGA